MSLEYVTLVLDAYDGQGNIVTKGSASFVPSVQLTDPGVEWIPPAPIPGVFRAGSVPQVKLLSTDSTDALPNGWTWAVTFSGVPGDPDGFSFYLPYTGGATQYLSDLAEVPAVTPMAQYMPLPSGTAGEGDVPVATGSGNESAWGSGGGSGAVSSVFGRTGVVAATSGDYTVSEVTGAAPLASPALTGSPTAPTKTALTNNTDVATTAYADSAVGVEKARALAAEGALVSSVAAGDTSIVIGGTATAPTIETATLDVIATDHPPAGSWSNNSHSITNVAVLSMVGNTGATHATRYAGGTTSGAPGSGTFNTGDFVVDQSGTIQICTAGGTPGTWAALPKAAAVALLAGTTMTGYLAPAVATLSFVGSGTTLVNAALGNVFALTLTDSTTTLGNPTNPVDGQAIRVRVIQGSGGSFTLAYGTAYDFGAAGAPTLSTAAGKVDVLGFEYVASLSKWAYLGSGLGF